MFGVAVLKYKFVIVRKLELSSSGFFAISSCLLFDNVTVLYCILTWMVTLY